MFQSVWRFLRRLVGLGDDTNPQAQEPGSVTFAQADDVLDAWLDDDE